MHEQQTSYEAIVRADIAIEIMNKACGLVSERIFRTEILPDYLPGDIGNAERPTLIVLGAIPVPANQLCSLRFTRNWNNPALSSAL